MDRVGIENISIRTHHTEGVVLIMSKKMERTLIEWKQSGSILLRFNSKYTKRTDKGTPVRFQ